MTDSGPYKRSLCGAIRAVCVPFRDENSPSVNFKFSSVTQFLHFTSVPAMKFTVLAPTLAISALALVFLSGCGNPSAATTPSATSFNFGNVALHTTENRVLVTLSNSTSSSTATEITSTAVKDSPKTTFNLHNLYPETCADLAMIAGTESYFDGADQYRAMPQPRTCSECNPHMQSQTEPQQDVAL